MKTPKWNTFDFHISYLKSPIKNLVKRQVLSGDNSGVVHQRAPSFWTVGMATYKDGVSDIKAIEKNNELLYKYFPDFYDYQIQKLQTLLEKPVCYMKNMPLPGFHVFVYCKEFEKPLARPHVDVPFNKYDWGKEVGEDDIFTHVIGVEVPKDAGFYMWDYEAKDMAKEGPDVIVERARKTVPDALVHHMSNKMIIHTGKNVHMIKPFSGPTDMWRITLQSHAVFKDGVWQLYW